MIVHNVYFSLHDKSEAAKAKLIKACQFYLTEHPGLSLFACGILAPELARPVNDVDFDVALHTVFATRADHDLYQVAPRHLQFIEENKADWAKVRVFDSLIEA